MKTYVVALSNLGTDEQCMCLCVEAQGCVRIFLITLYFIYGSKTLPWIQSSPIPASLSSQPALRLPVCFPSAGMTVGNHVCLAFTWVLGPKVWSLYHMCFISPATIRWNFWKNFIQQNSLVTVSLKFQVPCWFSLEAVITQSPTVWCPASELRTMSASFLLTWCLFPVTSSMEGPLDMDYVLTIFTSAQYIVDGSLKEGVDTLLRGPE